MTETNISIARVPQVTVIDPRIPEKAKLRVAAYARVSSDSEDQVNSYIAQVDFYTKHIAGKEDWEMVDIYADEGISGLEARNRDDFNRMMADCREGKIDRVLCKSISRFARNTQEYIQFVRELLRLGISIHFEKENIDTGKMTSEQVPKSMELSPRWNRPTTPVICASVSVCGWKRGCLSHLPSPMATGWQGGIWRSYRRRLRWSAASSPLI